MWDNLITFVSQYYKYPLVGNIEIHHLVFSLGIFLIFLILRKVFTHYVFSILLKLAHKNKTEVGQKLLKAFEKPMAILFIVLGLYLALGYLPLAIEYKITINQWFRSLLVILVAWGIYDLTGNSSLLSYEFKEKLKIDNILISFFTKVFRFLVVALATVIVLQELGYRVDGFIAGLGLGGLAFALAAKDMLANIFGGIVIIFEKPFLINDWIATPSAEGIVEDISFRSTKIRQFNQSLITLPNSTLANEPITNYSKMGKRRITFNLGVTYTTPRKKLQECVYQIKQMLIDHPDIHPETIFVHFDKYNDSSLDIFIYCFTNTTNWGTFLRVKEDINFKIMEILEQLEVSVAFPSRSLYFETPQTINIANNSQNI